MSFAGNTPRAAECVAKIAFANQSNIARGRNTWKSPRESVARRGEGRGEAWRGNSRRFALFMNETAPATYQQASIYYAAGTSIRSFGTIPFHELVTFRATQGRSARRHAARSKRSIARLILVNVIANLSPSRRDDAETEGATSLSTPFPFRCPDAGRESVDTSRQIARR